MMRVQAGSLKGRELIRPKTAAVRPLGDKTRAALFDVLGDVSGLTVLDAYAGSGAVGLEALSRGAAMVEAIEQSRAAWKVIQQNIQRLGIVFHYQLDTLSVERWLANPGLAVVPQFDIIFADPPYAKLDASLIDRLGECLKAGGVMAVSHSSRQPAPELESVKLVKSRQFGDTTLSFYKR